MYIPCKITSNHHFPMVFLWFSHGFPIVCPGDKWPDEVLAELRKLRDAMPAAPFHTTRKTIQERQKRQMVVEATGKPCENLGKHEGKP